MEAIKVAAKWEHDLREGRYQSPWKITWNESRRRYEDEYLASLSDNNFRTVTTNLNSFERMMHPKLVRNLTRDLLSRYQEELRNQNLAESTIKGRLVRIQAVLNWAHEMGMITSVPKISRIKRAKNSKLMKGRPITAEEFERMLSKVPDVVAGGIDSLKRSKNIIDSWTYYLQGLWLSGLRLTESLELWWDRDDRLCLDLSGRRPMMCIPAELKKGHEDRLLPITPDFAEFLLATSRDQRTGRVFHPLTRRESGKRIHKDTAGDLVSAIGKAAGVKVWTHQKTGKVKYASAHDLRRSFGSRWAMRVMPVVLMQLMRHKNIVTTLRYYVGQNATATSDEVWKTYERQAAGDTLGDSSGIPLIDNLDGNPQADSRF